MGDTLALNQPATRRILWKGCFGFTFFDELLDTSFAFGSFGPEVGQFSVGETNEYSSWALLQW